jgi:2-keto-4-pentenoate hydratase/2-oxohepta-3-ene-1,7-dioic acid hydratase in catechol pathway
MKQIYINTHLGTIRINWDETLPGDVIITGTPAGIGPMPAKSTIAVSIEGLGQLTNRVSAKP